MSKFNFSRSSFSDKEEQKLKILLSSPATEILLSDLDKERVAKRIELARQLDGLDKRHDADIEKALAADLEAAKKVEALGVQLRSAEEAQQETAIALFSARGIKDQEYFSIRKALYDSRDSRLDEYLIHIGSALDSLRHAPRFWFEVEGRRHFGFGSPILVQKSNADDVTACMNLLKVAREKVEGMALQPLTHAEVSERLNAISGDIGPRLKEFLIAWPYLDAEGEVRLEVNFTREREATVHRPGSIKFPREERKMAKAKRTAELDRLAK